LHCRFFRFSNEELIMHVSRRKTLKGLGQDFTVTDIGTTEFWGAPDVSIPDVSGAFPGFNFTLPSLKDIVSLAQAGAGIYATVTSAAPPLSAPVYNPVTRQYTVPGGAGYPTALPAGSVAPAVAFGISPGTKNLMILGAAVFGGIFLIGKLIKR
jgi:hypothetical protein